MAMCPAVLLTLIEGGASYFTLIITAISILNVSLHRVVRKKVANLMYVACIFLYFDQVQVRDLL